MLPVRVLQHNVNKWWEQDVDPDFLKDAMASVEAGNLDPGIAYHIDRDLLAISKGPFIRKTDKIHIQENYLQFQWCVAHVLNVYFREGFLKPFNAGMYDGKIDLKNDAIYKARHVFEQGLKLWQGIRPELLKALPNPECPDPEDTELVGLTNGVYAAAVSFILMHEYGHHKLGHVGKTYSDEENKRIEQEADDYALGIFARGMLANPNDEEQEKKNNTNTMGAIAAMLAIVLRSERLTKKDYPDPDIRLERAVEALNRGDDAFYAVACYAMTLWSMAHGKDLNVQQLDKTSYRALYADIKEQLKSMKAGR